MSRPPTARDQAIVAPPSTGSVTPGEMARVVA